MWYISYMYVVKSKFLSLSYVCPMSMKHEAFFQVENVKNPYRWRDPPPAARAVSSGLVASLPSKILTPQIFWLITPLFYCSFNNVWQWCCRVLCNICLKWTFPVFPLHDYSSSYCPTHKKFMKAMISFMLIRGCWIQIWSPFLPITSQFLANETVYM